MRFLLTIGLAGALAALPSLALAQKDDDQAGVAEAIRYEKAKQAAADRQARIESGRAREDHSADRVAPENRTKPKTTRTAQARKSPPPPRPDQH